MPQLSHELLYQLTRRHNSYLRPNLHATFTADPFSATNIPNAGAWGFLTPKATSLLPVAGEAGQLLLMKKSNRRRTTKKAANNNNDNKNDTKVPGSILTVKTVDSKKAVGHRCEFVQARGVRLRAAALRAAKLGGRGSGV